MPLVSGGISPRRWGRSRELARRATNFRRGRFPPVRRPPEALLRRKSKVQSLSIVDDKLVHQIVLSRKLQSSAIMAECTTSRQPARRSTSVPVPEQPLSQFRRIFFHFPQVRLRAFNLAILFLPFGRKVFNRLGDVSFFYIFVDFLSLLHNFSLPPLHASAPHFALFLSNTRTHTCAAGEFSSRSSPLNRRRTTPAPAARPARLKQCVTRGVFGAHELPRTLAAKAARRPAERLRSIGPNDWPDAQKVRSDSHHVSARSRRHNLDGINRKESPRRSRKAHACRHRRRAPRTDPEHIALSGTRKECRTRKAWTIAWRFFQPR